MPPPSVCFARCPRVGSNRFISRYNSHQFRVSKESAECRCISHHPWAFLAIGACAGTFGTSSAFSKQLVQRPVHRQFVGAFVCTLRNKCCRFKEIGAYACTKKVQCVCVLVEGREKERVGSLMMRLRSKRYIRGEISGFRSPGSPRSNATVRRGGALFSELLT